MRYVKKIYWDSLTKMRENFANRKALPEVNPVLVYSMRKVASTTLTSTLRAEGHVVYKQHCIDQRLNDELSDALYRTGASIQHWLSDGLRFRRQLEKWRTQRQDLAVEGCLKIFTLVRDPLAIALSDFFMQLFEFFPKHVAGKDLESPDNLRHYFITVLDALLAGAAKDPLTDFLRQVCDIPRLSFDRELRASMGIDVLRDPYIEESGYRIYTGYDSKVVVIRADKLSLVALDAITFQTGVPPRGLVERNVSAMKNGGDLYRSLVTSSRLPTSILREFYRQPWLSHFFNEAELEDMLRKWSL